MMPSQCAQAESALYWFSWRNTGCLGTGIESSLIRAQLTTWSKFELLSFTIANRTDNGLNQISEAFLALPYRLHMIAST